jgi:hypothetical protein
VAELTFAPTISRANRVMLNLLGPMFEGSFWAAAVPAAKLVVVDLVNPSQQQTCIGGPAGFNLQLLREVCPHRSFQRQSAFETRLLRLLSTARQCPRMPIRSPARCSAGWCQSTDARAAREQLRREAATVPTFSPAKISKLQELTTRVMPLHRRPIVESLQGKMNIFIGL